MKSVIATVSLALGSLLTFDAIRVMRRMHHKNHPYGGVLHAAPPNPKYLAEGLYQG